MIKHIVGNLWFIENHFAHVLCRDNFKHPASCYGKCVNWDLCMLMTIGRELYVVMAEWDLLQLLQESPMFAKVFSPCRRNVYEMFHRDIASCNWMWEKFHLTPSQFTHLLRDRGLQDCVLGTRIVLCEIVWTLKTYFISVWKCLWKLFDLRNFFDLVDYCYFF